MDRSRSGSNQPEGGKRPSAANTIMTSISGGGGRNSNQPAAANPIAPVQPSQTLTQGTASGGQPTWSSIVSKSLRSATEIGRGLPSGSLSSTSSLVGSLTLDHQAYVPIERPDHGTLAMSSINLLVNHFHVDFDPLSSILCYSINIKEKLSVPPFQKPVPKWLRRDIIKKFCVDDGVKRIAYDGDRIIFSAISLPIIGTHQVEVFGRAYMCTVKMVNTINLSKLQENEVQVPYDILNVLEIVTKENLSREKVFVCRAFYPREHKEAYDLNCGVAAYKGSKQSLKLTSKGLILCTDFSVTPFRKRIGVLCFLKEHVRNFRTADDINNHRTEVVAALKGLKVSVNHRPTKQKYQVSGLTIPVTENISFEIKDEEGMNPKSVKLTDYFMEKWGKNIAYKHIPCLLLLAKNKNKRDAVPIEFCVIAEDKRFPKNKLGHEAAQKLKELSLVAPETRREEILNMVRDEYASGTHGAEVLQNFKMRVSTDMTHVDGRVLEPPTLKLGETNIVTDNKIIAKKFVTAKSLERWGLIDFTKGHRNKIDHQFFIGKLKNQCIELGVKMEEALYVYHTSLRELSDVNSVKGLFGRFVKECKNKDEGQLQMIICVMPERHVGYKYIKQVSEIEIGVMTQCCLSEKANSSKNYLFLVHLGMKINAKLGGSNIELDERFSHFKPDAHFMLIGADVNHPSNQSSPSIAAVVGSVNWPAATRYAARVAKQTSRQEEIADFGRLCLDLIEKYEEVNGVKPAHIVVLRDGVGDAQFGMVLNKELVDMKKAFCAKEYYPFVTVVVAQKGHATRLFLDNATGSVPPGTVVDMDIVHPTNFDFYLCSYFGAKGTSRPTHYTVIWDENKFSSDEMQKMVYHLCYTCARGTNLLSLVPPVYYADLAAYRGRMFEEVVEGSGSFEEGLYNLNQHVKDSMFFI